MSAIKSNFIPDGYTKSAYIAERPGIYYECRFKHRPVLHGERNQVQAAIGNAKDSNAASAVIYRLIEKNVVEWDQVDQADKPLKCTAVNIARMAPEFIERLFNVVCGFQASDHDPTTGQPEVPEADELTKLLEGGSAATDAQQEADAKN